MRAHTQTGKTKGRQENDKTACTLHPGRRGTKNNLFVFYSQSGGFCESRDVRAPNFCQNLLIGMQIKVNPKFKVAQTPGDRWRSAFYCGVWCQEAEPVSLLSFFFSLTCQFCDRVIQTLPPMLSNHVCPEMPMASTGQPGGRWRPDRTRKHSHGDDCRHTHTGLPGVSKRAADTMPITQCQL